MMRLIITLLLCVFVSSCSNLLSDEELEARYKKAEETQQWNNAIPLLDELIERNPHNANYYFMRALAISNVDLKRSEDIIRDLNKYLDKNPKESSTQFFLAQAYIIDKDYKKAIEIIDQLIKLKGKNSLLLSWKGNAAFADKQFKLAEETYNERLRLSGTYDDLKNTYYYNVFSKHFGGNKEGAQWDCAFLSNRGFKEDNALMKSLIDDTLVFEELAQFEMPRFTIHQIGELLDNNCKGIDIFKGRNYSRSELMEELAHVQRTEDLKTLLPNKENIYVLNLTYTNLTELPKEVFQFINLEALNISNNTFKDKKKLFEDLSKLPNLKVLTMYRCNLRQLPDNISLLKNLEVLNVATNGLKEINENIGELTKLKLLDVGSNSRLKDLPKAISKLRCLQRLDVSGSGLTRLRDELANCSQLVSISANACKIKTIPVQVGNLVNLKHFNLGYNKIEELPVSFGGLSALESINLGSNDLSVLPNEIIKLQNVQSVSFNYNRFKEFPKEVLALKNVHSIWVHNNSFKTIPVEVAKMPKIRQLLIDEDVITDDNIKALKAINSEMYIVKEDSRKYVKGRKRKI